MERTLNDILSSVHDPGTKIALQKAFRLVIDAIENHAHKCGGDGVVSSVACTDPPGHTATTPLTLPK